jgi:hypothetical protein
MQRNTKQTIAVIVSLLILFVAVYGSYMPMRKAEMFIGALQSLQSQPPTSVGDLESRVSPSLNYPSPIGQEELVRNLANSVLGFVQGSQDASSTEALLSFMDGYYAPIIARGRGMSFGQDIYLMGAIHEIAFVRTGNPAYLDLSKQYYQEGVALGPERPQSLYGLFDVYRFENDATDAESTAEKILSLWPTDTNIQSALQALQVQIGKTGSPSPTQ